MGKRGRYNTRHVVTESPFFLKRVLMVIMDQVRDRCANMPMKSLTEEQADSLGRFIQDFTVATKACYGQTEMGQREKHREKIIMKDRRLTEESMMDMPASHSDEKKINERKRVR